MHLRAHTLTHKLRWIDRFRYKNRFFCDTKGDNLKKKPQCCIQTRHKQEYKKTDRPTHRPTNKNYLIVKLKDNKIFKQRHYRITQVCFVKQRGQYINITAWLSLLSFFFTFILSATTEWREEKKSSKISVNKANSAQFFLTAPHFFFFFSLFWCGSGRCMHCMVLQFAHMIATFRGSDNEDDDSSGCGGDGTGSDGGAIKRPKRIEEKYNHNYTKLKAKARVPEK